MTGRRDADEQHTTLVLFRNDLRIHDNRALAAAAASGRQIVPVLLWDEESEGVRPIGAARRWWLHHSIVSLSASLEQLGATLILRRGATDHVVEALIEETGADTVLWNRRYDPPESAVDARLKARLKGRGVHAESFEGHLLHEPSKLTTGGGGPYRVYTPFWRALAALPEPRDPVDAPKAIRPMTRRIASERLVDWGLLPTAPDWSGGMREAWEPGETGARKRLAAFLDGAIDGYDKGRDFPGVQSTSRLSPHLAHGEITPFQIFAALRQRSDSVPAADADKFRKEVAWREFAYHLLFHNHHLATRNYNGDFAAFPWHSDRKMLRRWQAGQTGYPIVDAGMRELWRTGWMHNRVRMIVASFLVKHLLIDWREGERWFWDTLVDADCANNPASWQWVAGSGADAAPYFRIFNPVLQGERFDEDGAYVRAHVPELSRLPDKAIHSPWDSPRALLSEAGVKLGDTYPVPVIDHAKARDRAMGAYQTMRGNS